MLNEEASTVYYCHQCQRNISPNLEDFTCPICNSGFIEEVEESPRLPSAAPFLYDIINQIHMSDDFDIEDDFVPTRRTQGRGGNNRGNQTFRFGTTTFRLPSQVSFFPFQEFFSNPMDYANSQDSFDLILTSIFNQSNGGPPPARKENIEKLERVQITDEMIKEHENCSICFEEYQKEQLVTKLPCSHLFHKECVEKWLELHGTCPICRKDLDGRDTSSDHRDDDFINLMDTIATNIQQQEGSSSSNQSSTTRPTREGTN